MRSSSAAPGVSAPTCSRSSRRCSSPRGPAYSASCSSDSSLVESGVVLGAAEANDSAVNLCAGVAQPGVEFSVRVSEEV